LGDSGDAPVAFSIAVLVLLLVALLTIQLDDELSAHTTTATERRIRSLIGWGLAIPAIVNRILITFAPDNTVYLVGSICGFLFFAFITINELRTVVRHKDVSGETISLSISIYLLIGFTWGLFYIVLHHLQPGAFNLNGTPLPSGPTAESQSFPTLLYFSMTTLSTIGFGDITPMTMQARYAAVAEGITGQFYLAILVARLVGLQMSQRADSKS
jgi:amino acid transporter